MLNKELPKIYNSAEHEDAIYAKWEKSGFFNPDNLSGEPYSIMMPPPNVTGVLHLGHALENSLMDIMARYQRMNGKKVLLLPGTDHAAVATQAKVEKLLVEQGLTNPRQKLGRDKLLEKIREYAENSKATILKQIKKMGTSCDWSRLAYTFDEARNSAVNIVFKKMYNDGLIYRGNRAVNWSVKGQSTCSDDELVQVERPAKLYTFKYAKDFPLAIATTRPETKLGDTAVAVNPRDKRYKKFIGQIFTVEVGAAKPLKIKIIADENVEVEFGTGAVGVTPAHSLIDFEMYEKQKSIGEPIGLIQVIDQHGQMTQAAGKEYAGLAVLAAREKFISWLKKQELLIKEEEITQNVGTSDRFGDAVEILPMTQWFVDVNKKIPGKNKSLKDLMREAVTAGHNNDLKQKITITPERFEKIYLNWIDNLRDWCVSRQIWWGHRIPVYYRRQEIFNFQFSIFNENTNLQQDIYVGEKPPEGDDWVQDEDTLDTWFSSGLWTFSTLGWPASAKATAGKPEKLNDLKTFHPTNWMQMGYEILFFWLARMILMSTYALDQIPFKDVYIHGMLRNELGKKFSKSSGNNLDPLEVAAKYGTDALRLSLISGIAPGNDSRFYEEKVEGARNMVNKLWNISRYIITNYPPVPKRHVRAGELRITNNEIKQKKLTQADEWILNNFQILVKAVKIDLENYNFSQAAGKLREFTWNYLADWYLEVCKFEKTDKKNEILSYLLIDLLKLWHPFIPFITEAIWAECGFKKMLIIENWPSLNKTINIKNNYFEAIIGVIKDIRDYRAENKIDLSKKLKVEIGVVKDKYNFIKSQEILIKSLKTGSVELEIKKSNKSNNEKFSIITFISISLVEGEVGTREKARLGKKINNLEKIIKATESRLANQEFIDKAPEAVVKKEKDKLTLYKSELKRLKG
ncbi:MAG: valine--tRNA ligase [Parcubacteria group bacterium]|nr:valine--tRNA ligase [Parcubacteria group bacterium]